MRIVGIERLRGRLDVVAWIAARDPVQLAAIADVLDEQAALGAAHLPQLGGRDRVDGGERGRVGRPRIPARAEMAIEQRAHRCADPRGDVDAVGDVADRHRLGRPLGPQRMPHLARDGAVAPADAVGPTARAQRELRHPEALVLVVGTRASQADDLVGARAERRGERAERVAHLVGRVRVVARRNRRVGREDHAAADVRERRGEVVARAHRGPRHLDGREGGVALVHVHDAGLDVERAQRGGAADAEQHVLRQAGGAVAVVQARRDPARGAPVLGQVGVEQQQRHPPHVDPPHLGGDLIAADRHRDAQRRPVLAGGDEDGRRALGVGRHPELLLPAAVVDALAEVAVAVHEPDGDERQGPVGCLLEDVAGQRAQPAGVDRQRGVHAVLGAEEGERPLLGERAGGGRPGQVGEQRQLELLGPCDERGIAGRPQQRLGRRLLQQPDRIAAARAPAIGIDVAKDVGAVGQPGPAVVVGQPREDAERPRQPRAQRARGAYDVLCSASHQLAHCPGAAVVKPVATHAPAGMGDTVLPKPGQTRQIPSLGDRCP